MRTRLSDGWVQVEERPLEELTVGIGQWNEPAIGGVPSTASSYAGFGPCHLMVMADGAAGPMPSRLGAQAATSAIVSAFRANAAQHRGQTAGLLPGRARCGREDQPWSPW